MVVTDGVVSSGPLTNFSGHVIYSTNQFSDSWGVVVAVGVTKPQAGNATSPAMDIDIQVFAPGSGRTNDLYVIFSDVDFGPTSGQLYSEVTGNNVVGTGGAISFSTYYDTNNVAMAMNSALAYSGPIFPVSGGYSYMVTNGDLTLTFPYSLTMVARISATNTATYALDFSLDSTGCLPSPGGLAGWWQGEGNGYEAVAGNNATLYGVGFTNGEVGDAFSFDGNSAFAYVPACSNLDVGQGQGLTIECWIKPDDIYNGGPLAAWDDGWGDIGVAFWVNWTDSGALSADLYDTNWNWYGISSPGGVLTAGSFQHVALTYDKSSGLAFLYFNGQGVATNSLGSFAPLTSFGLYLGGDPAWGVFYSGLLDEIGLYNSALGPDEIQAIYDAGSAGRCGIPPSFILEPASQTVTEGNTALLSSLAAGTSLNYQWFFNGSPLGGKTDPQLRLPDLQTNDSGSYSVRVTNTLGSLLSSNAVLIVPQAVCYQAPTGLISWWRAESNALDSAGSNDGALAYGVTFADGKVGQAFSFDGASGYIEVPDSPSLRLTNELTIEFWVQRRDLASEDYIINKGGDYTRGALDYGVTLNRSYWGCPLAFTFAGGYRRSVPIADTNWHHIAVAARNGDADPTFYVDGAQRPVTDRGGPETMTFYPSTEPLHIGAQIDTAWNYYSSALIDEVSLYNTMLSSNQVQAIYNASFAGKCQDPPTITLQPVSQNVSPGSNATFTASATGTPQLHYQWWFNGASLTGATRTSLTLTNVQLAQAGTYTVLVTNAFGSALSSNAVLAVGSAVPVVQITSPGNNQLFITSPTNILLVASATNSRGGTISDVVFYTNNAWLGEATSVSNQYQLVWQNVLPGTYSISAWATNNSGGYASDTVTNVIVNTMPVVIIVNPTNPPSLQTNLEPSDATLTAYAYDADGTVPWVQFQYYTNGGFTNLSGPVAPQGTNGLYSLVWNDLLAGNYPILAVATDNRGAQSVSGIRLLHVNSTNQPPTVAITFPTNGAVFKAGSDLRIQAQASGTNGVAVTNVDFFQGSVRLAGDNAAPYETDLHGLDPGTYSFTARATDANGLQAVSQPATVVVEEWQPLSMNGYWDPAFRTALGSGGAGRVLCLGSSNEVIAFVRFADSYSDIERWQSCDWHVCRGLGDVDGDVNAMLFRNPGFLLAGNFESDDGTWHTVAGYDGTNVTDLSFGLDNVVYALLNFKGDIIAGGAFTAAGTNDNVESIARLSGTEWVPVGSALDGNVNAIAAIGDDLYIGGDFTSAGGDTNVAYVAKLVGTNWVALGGGVNDSVQALAVWNGQLLAGGAFTTAGGDTNVAYLAKWDGSSWSSLGNVALSTDDPWFTPVVSALAVHGNDVFAAGLFDSVTGASGTPVQLGDVTHIQWDPSSLTWSWYAMDVGLADDPDSHLSANSLLLRPSSVTNAMDVIVGGNFQTAGSVPSYGLARWIIGANDCTNYPPDVRFYRPFSFERLDPGADYQLGAFATAAPDSQIDHVDFYADGSFIGSGYTNTPGAYSLDWLCTSVLGVHQLDAVATDTNGLVNKATLFVSVTYLSNNAPVLLSDQFTVFAGDPPTLLDVLANDTGAVGISALGSFVAVGLPGSTSTSASPGSVTIGYRGTNLVFQTPPNTFGTNLFWYSATNSAGVGGTAFVTVRVCTRPVVQITSPADGTVTSLTPPISVSSFDYDGLVTNVDMSLNGAFFARTNSPVFTLAWTTNTPGFYTFVAVATDNDGFTNASVPVMVQLQSTNGSGGHPVAAITNPPPAGLSLGDPVALPVRDGQLALAGSAYDLDGNPVSYQIVLLDPQNPQAPPLYNVTPAPRNSQGFHAGAVTNASLGTVDLSLVENGAYLLTLVVRGGGNQASTNMLIAVESGLKIGQFSFSEQDLVLPVNGIPLTVTRTYNSLNPRSADFGYSWTYSLMGMDVQLDDERRDVTIGSDEAPFADDEEDDNGLPLTVSIRTGGGWDVTLTLPDGRRTTFAFTPQTDLLNDKAYAQWTPPPYVHATLTSLDAYPDIFLVPQPAVWQAGGDDSTFDNHDISGWVLQTLDDTRYYITRGPVNNVLWDSTGAGNYINVQTYGPPVLRSIVQHSGDSITIGSGGIFHFAAGPNGATTTNLTRSALFSRDSQGRITAISDPNAGQGGLPSVKYVYNADTGNLLQVLKLTDRTAGTYLTTTYHYDNPAFPHYITSIENPLGVPVARNYYDDSGRLTAVVDADGNTTQFLHSTTNSTEVVIDRLGRTNIYAYDLQGNVTATTNALGGITLSAYDLSNNKTNEITYLGGQPYATNRYVFDTNGLMLVSYNPLGYSNVFTYNTDGQVITSTDPRGNTSTNYYDGNTGSLTGTIDALGHATTNVYNDQSLLAWSQDAVGTITANSYDGDGNLTATATLDASGILSTNSFTYDDNGNRTSSTVWRKVGAAWTNATTTYVYDGQNRVVQTINPDGGTNSVFYNEIGKQAQTIDPLGRVTGYTYDEQGRLTQTTYPDGFSESSAYDAGGNRTNSVDKLGRPTTYVYDALNRLVQTVYPDNTTNSTVYDVLGRVQFSVDARSVTNAFGYDAAGERIAVTNAWGTSQQMTNGSGFDANGNQTTFTDARGHTTTTVFDSLNRSVEVDYCDGTKTQTGYDATGRRVAETNQDTIVTRFGYDGAGRLVAVTNAFGVSAVQMVTQYQYDEAGNQTVQVDALNRTNSFAWDGLGRRTAHTLPGGQTESFGYDPAGNLTNYTSFNGVVITNQYDCMNRLTSRASLNGYQVSFAYSPTGQRTNMTDASGTTAYLYDSRDRLTNKLVSWSGGFSRALSYGYDANGNVTNILSSTSGGANLKYSYDPLNRITNVLAGGSQAASYGFDANGNLQSLHYANGTYNLCQYDNLNRLTNLVWNTLVNLQEVTLASFYYQLGKTGNRTNLSENVYGAARTYAWSYDALYRLRQETISSIGANSYGLDAVGNRTNRTAGLDSLPAQNFSYSANDWATTDAYDNDGNTLWTTNAATAIGPYYYDVENRLTNYNNSVFLGYNGDGIRVSKTAGGTATLYLVDDRNPSGYAQVLEESTASGGTTNLSRVYNWGLSLISQREAGGALYYFGYDGHGNTRLIGNTSVANTFAYDAFGNLIASNGIPQTTYLYCGEQFDPDLGMYYQRARYYQPGTGRFWTMDTYEGDQEAPLSLHKYLYCQGNPANGGDPSGCFGEDDFDAAIQADFYLQDMVPPFSDLEAAGGPDVTDALRRTLSDVDATYRLWNPLKRGIAAAYLYGYGAYAWDIEQLFEVDPDFHNRLDMGKGYMCGSGQWKGTVAVNEKVYYAGAVNYALYGKACKRSYDFFMGMGRPSEAAPYSLTAAKAVAAVWKAVWWQDFGESAREARAFVEYGYNGNLPSSGLATIPSGEVVKEDFIWVWKPYHD
jgi:RHS repeat-associated protein